MNVQDQELAVVVPELVGEPGLEHGFALVVDEANLLENVGPAAHRLREVDVEAELIGGQHVARGIYLDDLSGRSGGARRHGVILRQGARASQHQAGAIGLLRHERKARREDERVFAALIGAEHGRAFLAVVHEREAQQRFALLLGEGGGQLGCNVGGQTRRHLRSTGIAADAQRRLGLA